MYQFTVALLLDLVTEYNFGIPAEESENALQVVMAFNWRFRLREQVCILVEYCGKKVHLGTETS